MTNINMKGSGRVVIDGREFTGNNITIRGNFLKFYLSGRVKYRYKIKNGADLKEVLWEYFGINVEYRLKNDGMDYE